MKKIRKRALLLLKIVLTISLLGTTVVPASALQQPTVSLSDSAVTLNWGGGNEASVTVTASAPYRCKVTYGVGSNNNAWLYCFTSGNTLTVMPKGANYSDSSRTAYVVVTCGTSGKILTVTQRAYGQPVVSSSTPTIPKIPRGNHSADGQAMADLALSLVGTHKSALNPNWKAWCAPFVSYCANCLDLVGSENIFAGGNIANPLSILKNGKAMVYYFYDRDIPYTQTYCGNTYTWNWQNWTSQNAAPGKDAEHFMKGFSPVFDPNRDYIPAPGDLVFFKCSPQKGNDPWAHVGIITDYNSTTGNITFVDGNNNGNGLAGTSYGCNYVNKRVASLKNDILIMAVAHPNYH